MILTCPKCATRFFADDLAIGPAGRRVKCDACGEVWSSAGAEGPPDFSSRVAPADDPVAEVERAATIEVPLFTERGTPPRKPARGRSRAPWLFGALIVAIAIVGAFAFEHQIERMFPGASTVYRSVGLGSLGRGGG